MRLSISKHQQRFHVLSTCMIVFALSVANRTEWITWRLLSLLAVMPLLTQLVFWYVPHRGLLPGWATAAQADSGLGAVWSRLDGLYLLLLSIGSMLVLVDGFARTARRLHARSRAILAGAAVPLILQVLTFAEPNLTFVIDPALPALVLCALGFSFGLFGRGPLEAVPVTRRSVVDHMQDGWIILDAQNSIVDINAAAESMLGLRRESIYGQPVGSVLSEIPSLGNALEGTQELEMRRSVKAQDSWRYLSIRVSPLTNHHEAPLGRLIVWTDITRQRLTEHARQRARDEMFVLLSAISSAASQTIDLEEFLSEAIYQIIYPFRSQVVAIYLLDDRREENEGRRLYLASHLGLSDENASSGAQVSSTSPLMEWISQNRQPALIQDLANDPRTPLGMQGLELPYLLVSPLLAPSGEDGEIIGIICLGRKEPPVFTSDEIVRLTAVSEQIATLIDSSRRRKLAIALSERRRLMRDLHDSVSQKLYGLLALTEAAQASLDAGSSFDPSQILTRIGESARQAVREMRLFLYQIRPIDVEKDGIVAVLHHRLAAVEGRADIKARLLADEDLPLSKDKEVALYYIAQEALNNVMRHAYAKSVLVTLKQTKQNVILEIRDDGKGFDPKKADIAGMGLRNMKERTLQINGRFRIQSSPGRGTRIVITVPREHTVRRVERRRSP